MSQNPATRVLLYTKKWRKAQRPLPKIPEAAPVLQPIYNYVRDSFCVLNKPPGLAHTGHTTLLSSPATTTESKSQSHSRPLSLPLSSPQSSLEPSSAPSVRSNDPFSSDSLERRIREAWGQMKDPVRKDRTHIHFVQQVGKDSQGLVVVAFNQSTFNSMMDSILRNRWIRKARILVRVPPLFMHSTVAKYGTDEQKKKYPKIHPQTDKVPMVSPHVNGKMIEDDFSLRVKGTIRSFIDRRPATYDKSVEPAWVIPSQPLLKKRWDLWGINRIFEEKEIAQRDEKANDLPKDGKTVRYVNSPSENYTSILNPLLIKSGKFESIPIEYGGEHALTQYKLLAIFPSKGCALYDILFHGDDPTRKGYQARIHFAESGLPVVGDKIYRPLSPNIYMSDLSGINHTAFQAYHLTFQHPFNPDKIRLDIPAPTEWSGVLSSDCRIDIDDGKEIPIPAFSSRAHSLDTVSVDETDEYDTNEDGDSDGYDLNQVDDDDRQQHRRPQNSQSKFGFRRSQENEKPASLRNDFSTGADPRNAWSRNSDGASNRPHRNEYQVPGREVRSNRYTKSHHHSTTIKEPRERIFGSQRGEEMREANNYRARYKENRPPSTPRRDFQKPFNSRVNDA